MGGSVDTKIVQTIVFFAKWWLCCCCFLCVSLSLGPNIAFTFRFVSGFYLSEDTSIPPTVITKTPQLDSAGTAANMISRSVVITKEVQRNLETIEECLMTDPRTLTKGMAKQLLCNSVEPIEKLQAATGEMRQILMMKKRHESHIVPAGSIISGATILRHAHLNCFQNPVAIHGDRDFEAAADYRKAASQFTAGLNGIAID